MTLTKRLVGLICFTLGLALYVYAPRILEFDQNALLVRDAIMQVGGPLIAAICCFAAAWRSSRDKVSWTLFGSASLLYFGGNLYYMATGLGGIVPAFPSPAEWAYLAMAPIFAAGAFIYGRIGERVSRISLLNFLLIYTAITVATMFLLERLIEGTELDALGTLVAVGYPAIWVSVAAALLLSLLQYNLGAKTFPFTLLCMAAICEALADSFYAGAILDGTYARGGLTELLWVASVGLIVWAAFVQMSYARRPVLWVILPRSFRRTMQVGIPAAAILVALSAALFAQGLASPAFAATILAVVLALAALTALRERWIGQEQRQLRAAVEQNRAALLVSERELDGVLQATTDNILVLDRDWRVVFLNRHAETMLTTLLPALVVGARLPEVLPDMDSLLSGKMYRKAMTTREPVAFEEFFNEMWLDIHAYPTESGGISIFFRDVSAARRARDEIVHMAHHDPLTGLANRSLFHQRLVEAATSGKPSATLLLDLDHFKEINDTLGHPVGDRLLSETATRLRACLRPEDTIARLGGDEFAIILANTSRREMVASMAQSILDLAGASHDIDGQQIKVGASLGIALSSGVEDDADHLLRSADIALYAAKSEMRGEFRFFDRSMETGLLERQALRSQLVGAIERGEMELVYQPLVDLQTQQVSGFEALLRWRHPVHGIVPPSVFIPVAEESGIIVAIGAWVLKTACADAATWPGGISVSVNVSSPQFRDGDILIEIEEALETSGLSRDRLEIEITETVLLHDSKANIATLHRLRGLGIRIALDDFGTGYSSLVYLQTFPFSKIKIDRSFISGLPENEESQAIVKMVIGLGKALGLRVTAEGVETEAQLNWIRRGCDEAQGYLLSRPVPAKDVPAVIRQLGAPAGRERLRA